MGARAALRGPGRAGEVVRSLGPGDVHEDCRDVMRELARLESVVSEGQCLEMMSCQLGRETRGIHTIQGADW